MDNAMFTKAGILTLNQVNVEGKSEVAYEYTDFGETEINGDENFYNEICYTGGIYDNKTGLYYLNARYYNPEDGRFFLLLIKRLNMNYNLNTFINLFSYNIFNIMIFSYSRFSTFYVEISYIIVAYYKLV
ncbi:RHS repeat-associated core domain-containing protein [Terrisporobacter vanillatitrophus]|uniref:RHS repeat-associated core domain-containing protein n=1 Tax=Terrisporobacter vanillatitrophus TaxID=3058402 RepID=UPI003EBABE7F